MKYCTKCGNELFDEAVICPKCGCPVENAKLPQTIDRSSGSKTATKVFLIIGCIASAFFYLIPLAWCIPMTVSYFNAVKNGKKVSTAFKVCTLLFVSLVAGILMLCDNDDVSA